ncbi:MAG: hypothetical protein AABZ47_04595 [Planctomycetota bacterium]
MSGLILGAAARGGEESVVEWRSVPDGWFLVLAAAGILALCWAVIWMYRREGRIGASALTRWVLGFARCSVLVILAAILLEPVRVRILRRWVDSYTLVLVDSSSSMDLVDQYRDAKATERVKKVTDGADASSFRRMDVVKHVLEGENRSFLRRLSGKNRVKLFTFADEPILQGTLASGLEDPTRDKGSLPEGDKTGGAQRVEDLATTFSATGPATNVERAVRRAMESLAGAPIAAVVVLSDGGFNQGSSGEETGRFARDRHVPIHVVGIGDPSPPRNVRVVEVKSPASVFQQDPFPISVQVSTEGVVGETIQLVLRERDASGGSEGSEIETRSLPIGGDGLVAPLVFQRRQDRAGRYVYTVEVPTLEGESVTDDNARQVTINVIESRSKVLVVAGGPSWDYQYVSRLLQRDDTFDVSCWLQSADVNAVREGDVIIDHLPATAEEVFAYDVLILMDANPAELGEEWARLVDKYVSEYGGGLLLTVARPFTPGLMREPSLKPLRDLLPVTMDPEADLALNRIGHYQLSPVPVEIPPTAFGHPVMQLADDPVSTKLAWQGAGDIHWHYPVLREKPAATVLMRHGDPRMRNAFGAHVLAAVQFVGSGRSGYLGMDGTYRWRRYSETTFNRFWIQMVRFLGEGKLLGGHKRGMLLTDNDQLSLGEAVTVTARLFDARYEPLARDKVVANVMGGEGKAEVILAARPDRPGWFDGRFIPDRVGGYRISLLGVGEPGEDGGEIVREIRVSRPNLEIARPQMDRAALQALAQHSEGGKYFELDEVSQISDLIQDLHEEISVRSRPTILWDTGAVMTLLVVLLSFEWAVRKWRHLL